MHYDRTVLIVAVLLVLVGGVLGLRTWADAQDVPQVGQMAPAFTLPSQEGTNVSLEQFRGQWVVLYFYPKDQTPGCTVEARNFQRDLEKYSAMHAVILGVSVDTVQSHQAFCAKDGLHFKLLADPGAKVVAAYGSLGNYMGFKIAKRNTFLIGPDGRIVKEWIGVSPSGHSQEVLAAITAMQKNGKA